MNRGEDPRVTTGARARRGPIEKLDDVACHSAATNTSPAVRPGSCGKGEGMDRGVAGTPFVLSTNPIGFDEYDYNAPMRGGQAAGTTVWSPVRNNAPVVCLRWTDRDLVALAAD